MVQWLVDFIFQIVEFFFMYKIFIKPLLFLLSPEKAHQFTGICLRFLCKIPGLYTIVRNIYTVKNKKLERTVFGIKFPNPVGLAAGFDKNATLFNELSGFGFGFIEIGTVTPLPQKGNPKPRLFRFPVDQALINRMGFNNDGAAAVAQRLKNKKGNIIIGGNIGKNKDTPNELSAEDYLKSFHLLYNHVDYFTVNVSSPNTPGLRMLQDKDSLNDLLTQLQQLNSRLSEEGKLKPVILKIAPDLTNEQLDGIVDIVLSTGTAGIIATNTTIGRDGLKTEKLLIDAAGTGGLSGKPLNKRSTEIIRYICNKSNRRIAVIGSGGIHSSDDAIEMLRAGACLVQVYTGFIYEGPSLVKKINKRLMEIG